MLGVPPPKLVSNTFPLTAIRRFSIISSVNIKTLQIRTAIILLFLLAAFLFYISILPRLSLIGKKTDYKVYVAYGFHINLYHSYRIDTNNEEGFGKDIRIIRKIIDVLDKKIGKEFR